MQLLVPFTLRSSKTGFLTSCPRTHFNVLVLDLFMLLSWFLCLHFINSLQQHVLILFSGPGTV